MSFRAQSRNLTLVQGHDVAGDRLLGSHCGFAQIGNGPHPLTPLPMLGEGSESNT
jgi:hypothetical protein